MTETVMDSAIIGWNLLDALDILCRRSGTCSNRLSGYLKKKSWSKTDRDEVLEVLSELLVQNEVADFGELFRPLLLELVSRAREQVDKSGRHHREFCIALSHCIHWPDIQRFMLKYLRGKPSFIKTEPTAKGKQGKEKQRIVCRAAWLLAHHLGDASSTVVPLEDLQPYLSHTDDDTRWFACQAVIEQQALKSSAQQQFLKNYFDERNSRIMKIRHTMKRDSSQCHETLCSAETTNEQLQTDHMILETDLIGSVVCVGGVLLSKMASSSTDTCAVDLLPVPSNEMNLHSVAVAVSAGSPVLLQGVVGSGKTSLVEHLARRTGRTGPPHLVKIQLGDQMDSKALLGTYGCTEVAGEFVWRPGVLTEAVSHGYWVLLEDLDHAPMEVVSVLLPLLETRTLTVPGHGDTITAHPHFQLFATQRLVSGSSGWQKQQASAGSLLDQLWTTVLVEPMSRAELAQVLCHRHPQLETVMEKLLDIYFLMSAGGHQGSDDVTMETDSENVGRFLSHDGRLISTRDLMTWCGRIAMDFNISSVETASMVFQEALDCFVSSLPRIEKRLPLAEAIGARLNITKVKAEYFSLKYKPEVSLSSSVFTVGRVQLPIQKSLSSLTFRKRSTFSFTRQSSVLLEKIAVCVNNQEPVLLVGETGTGKTSSVQYLAEQLGHNLHVINMNQQSDSADLLGGFKPVDVKHIIKPFFEDFELLFCKSFSRKQNVKFIGHLQDCYGRRQWDTLFTLMEHTTKSALDKYKEGHGPMLGSWTAVSQRLGKLKLQVHQTETALAFSFMEGSLVKALRAGDWVLLDEINLAAMETLECLSGLLESSTGSVLLMERGDIEPVVRHQDFRLFACMNPATDVGKKDLSPGIRNRFTELFVDELEDSQDLKVLVSDYLHGLSLSPVQVDSIVKFYQVVRGDAVNKLTDGTGHRPHYSLRTLCRALRFAAANSCESVPRSLYEGFCLSFLTELDRSSHPLVEKLVCKHVISKSNAKSLLQRPLPAPPGGRALNFEGYYISRGELEPCTPQGYILTPSVRANLKDLARIVSAGQHPVLLQGETSVGKTSLIRWLAESSGNVCVRVNNHEHTDLQEYVGCYAADENGKLAFKEGVLVEAMRKGHWIILDELNLAPTDVLEALNRLLDDNRELYISETQETVKAHTKFMLFATQNPPGQYAGRKVLSRAFRNRFVELHFDEIPSAELETILHERCDIPLSYARRMVAVMLELQKLRRGSGVFAGKMGFMTLRDLFRWAGRYKRTEMDGERFYDWDKHLAEQGYMLLAGRVRKAEEGDLIQTVVQKHFKCTISVPHLFTLGAETSRTTSSLLDAVINQTVEGFQHIVWTHNMRRMAVLIGQAVRYKEPVLLVGETGCGKTTMCQLYAALQQTSLLSVNCHLHTESADFLGGLRPVRAHSEADKKDKLFEWVDGPLVQAMKQGAMFLIDEISLADDSVLERLNSVLEPERTILLAEKGGGDGSQNEVEQVVATDGFHVFGTMNPGGDFGKKELSPALRNRFTEIWCPASSQRQDLVDIIEHNVHSGIHLCNQEDGTSGIGRAIMQFITWFSNNELAKRCTVSIRDILTWVNFINTCSTILGEDNMEMEDSTQYNKFDPAIAYIHGACLVFLDGLGAGITSQGADQVVTELRAVCLAYLLKQVNTLTHQQYQLSDLYLLDNSRRGNQMARETEHQFCIPPFSIAKGSKAAQHKMQYALEAPGTCVNAQRVLRALQLPRPLLLEGSPGVGKTSLVTAIARAAGRELVRINLSEQTDVSDLFGADLPVEGEEGGVFAWRDGPLLQALKAGSWIVLDEMNLASQSVLEGLNACLDHRAEVYVPELGKTFHIQHESTRLFACQNPLNQGGGRKGLPRSFLNRFTQVYIEPLCEADLMFIAGAMYPDLPTSTLALMVKFNMQIHEATGRHGQWGQRGSPWEFNLRDLFRWCDLLLQNQLREPFNPGEYVGLVYADRMRTQTDKHQVFLLYTSIFPETMPVYQSTGILHCDYNMLQVGHSFLEVRSEGRIQGDRSADLQILHHSLEPLESLMKCVAMNWMAIVVGPACSGKTSVVEMLAQLTGNQLNVLAMNSAMDTTELLGGFEQADLSRHVEQCAADVKLVVADVCERCLLQGNMNMVVTLHNLCSQASHQTAGDKRSSLEELSSLRQQVSTLISTLNHCRTAAKQFTMTTENTKSIPLLKKTLKKLKKKIVSAVPGNGGGAFEWVDSVLVKSLKLGHWLLIDNVNFCSASVLDRLNALLEPHGVLSINEKGVIDGEIPTVTPHTNFRLFLSMDPRHGEISRAMRNRGVEIYTPGEENGKPFSEGDLLRIAFSMGLTSKPAFDWLRQLHDRLKEELPMGDKPSIQSLLQVLQHYQHHVNQGYTLEEAMQRACYCVYVQKQRHTTSKQVATGVLTDHSGCWKTEVSDHEASPVLGLWPVRLPGIQEVCRDPGSAAILRNAALVAHTIARISTGDCTQNEHKLRCSLNLLLSLTSVNNIPQTVDWLQAQYLHKNTSSSSKLSSGRNQSARKIVTTSKDQSMIENLLNRLPHVHQDMLVAMETLGCSNLLKQHCNRITGDFPVDVRWNPQLLQRCILESGSEAVKGQLSSMFNRLHALQYFLMEMSVVRRQWLALQEELQRVELEGTRTTHEALPHLVAMFPELCSAITDTIPQTPLDSYTDVSKLLDGISWIRRLFEVCTADVSQVQMSSQLCLHWKWFHKRALPACLGYQSQFPKLDAIVGMLEGILRDSEAGWKVFVKYWRSWGHPSPFKTESSAQQYLTVMEFHSLLDQVTVGERASVSLTVACRQPVLDLFSRLLFQCTEDQQIDMEGEMDQWTVEVKALLEKYGLRTKDNPDTTCEMETDQPQQTPCNDGRPSLPVENVELWPLFDYTSAVQGWTMAGEIMAGKVADDKVKQAFIDFASAFTPMSPKELAVYGGVRTDNLKVMLPELVSAVLLRLRRSPAVYRTRQWLSWNSELPDQEENTSLEQRCFHEASLSSILHELLSRADHYPSTITPANVRITAPLKSYTREITQLAHISQHAWSHSAWYSNKDRCTRTLDISALHGTLCHSLLSIASLLDTGCLGAFTKQVDTIAHGQLKTVQPEQIHHVKTTILSGLSGVGDRLESLTQSVSYCLDSVAALLEDRGSSLSLLAEAWVGVALLNMDLLAPRGPVDPVEKLIIKLGHLKQELLAGEEELEILCDHHRLLTGQNLTGLPSDLVHPRVTFLLTRKGEITQQIEHLSQLVAYRPTPPQYGQLVVDVHNYMTSIASVGSVHGLMRKLKKAVGVSGKPVGVGHLGTLLQELGQWELSQDKFVALLHTEYPLYRDITAPFCSAVAQVTHGMHVMHYLVHQRHAVSLLAGKVTPNIQEQVSQLEQMMVSMGRFPAVSSEQQTCLQLASCITSDHTLSLVQGILPSEEETRIRSLVSNSLLLSGLHLIENEARTRGRVTSDLLQALTHILEVYVSSWYQEEEARKEREAEKASLYRFKSQVHGDERSEEEKEEEEFRENFPHFQQDYMDLVEPASLEDTGVLQAADDPDPHQATVHVSDFQMTQICGAHQLLYNGLVQTDWYCPVAPEPLQTSDWIKPFLSSFTAAHTLGGRLSDVLGSDVDRELLGGQLLISAVQQHYIVKPSLQEKSPLLDETKVYDIYHDSNVSQVIQCVPVLHSLRARVRELLQEWPDHPTLSQLCEIMDRIESFAISSPVVKFLTGLELLLQKAQDWESNASQHVSMATQLADMSRLVIEWRKLELSCWMNALDTELHRYRNAASKWWFHLYQLVHSVLFPQDDSDDASVISSVTKALKQFIEGATLGDFGPRLSMLLSFHCQLIKTGVQGVGKQLSAVLWHMHQFYARFTDKAQREVDKLRGPIEKELKGFVKIARWSDINYWALKQTTEKTHRAVHKHVRQFKNVLRQPVQAILGDSEDGDAKPQADNNSWADGLLQYNTHVMNRCHMAQVSDSVAVPVWLDEALTPLQWKLPHLSSRYNKLWNQVLAATKYPEHLVSLDQSIGELIEGIHEMQSLQVNKDSDKDKQKSEAKHINLRKRKALSELFRYLAKLGVSYRKGLAHWDTNSNDVLQTPPLDLAVAHTSDSSVLSAWSGCLEYFYRCVARRAQYNAALTAPSKELGISILDRCRGCTGHLYNLMVQQYSAVAQASDQYSQIQQVQTTIKRLVEEAPQTIIPQEEACRWVDQCEDMVVQMLEGLNQFLVLLHCCPGPGGTGVGPVGSGGSSVYPSPVPVSHLHPAAQMKLADEQWTQVFTAVQGMLTDVQSTRETLQNRRERLMLRSDVEALKGVFVKLSSTVPRIEDVCKLFSDPEDQDQSNAFTSVLHCVCGAVKQMSKDFHDWYPASLQDSDTMCGPNKDNKSHSKASIQSGSDPTIIDSNSSEQTVLQGMETVISDMLIVVQRLHKQNVSPQEAQAANMEDTVDEDAIHDGHLVKILCDKLHVDSQNTNCDQVVSSLNGMVRTATEMGITSLVPGLARCLPLLQQYSQTIHHQLMCNIATLRTIGKLLSVLLALFTELTTQGFCIPPELSDEMEGEGATEFSDIEQGGLGEGEGAKNVSDQIEDEDQLDDAKRPEDRKEEDSSEQPDVKSEENAIEMSDDFDGKIQDLEDADKQEDNEEDDKGDEEDIDKQMGDIEEQGIDKLDEQMWGSDEEEDSKEEKEESGPGDGKESAPELVAKDDNEDKTSKDDKEAGPQQEEEEPEEEEEEQKPHSLDQLNQDEYDDDHVDPYHGKEMEEKEAPEDMDLPEDLKLDDGEGDDKEGDDGAAEEEKVQEEDTTLPPEEEGDQTEEPAVDKEEEEGKDKQEENPQEMEEGADKSGEDGQQEDMETEERQEEEGKDEPGFTAQDDPSVETEEKQDDTEDTPEMSEHHGVTSHDTETVEQSDSARDQAGQATENNQQEMDGMGQASTEQAEGHQGQTSTRAIDSSTERKRKHQERQPGQSDSDRSLGSADQKYKKLKTTDTADTSQEEKQDDGERQQSDLYQHVKDSSSHHDAQTLDAATDDQVDQQATPTLEEGAESDMEEDVDMELLSDDENKQDEDNTENMSAVKLTKKTVPDQPVLGEDEKEREGTGQEEKVEIPGTTVLTASVGRGPESTIHTEMDHLHLDHVPCDLESLRADLENQLGQWNQSNQPSGQDTESAASDLWHKYEALTSSLSQDLCEQLRLVLEPTQATKLRGDYRTGKRLNMRKVIPYIASQFRKDKIWLRRTKPSKRQYQVMLAIDDSSSMVDNHSKQMAFESLALISNALTLLEAGQLCVCSFGETVNVLHPFTDQFSSQSGAHLLQYFTFEQKKTKIAQLMRHATRVMLEARQQRGAGGSEETAQLLLIVSDGRGLFMEGVDVVKSAVRQARHANVFLVFVIIDNPANKDSILDIKVPIFKGGQVPEIKSYMDYFPFPFYIILRDINSLPLVLSDALRQWFELVSAVDR